MSVSVGTAWKVACVDWYVSMAPKKFHWSVTPDVEPVSSKATAAFDPGVLARSLPTAEVSFDDPVDEMDTVPGLVKPVALVVTMLCERYSR